MDEWFGKRVPGVYAEPRDDLEWEICLEELDDDDWPRRFQTRWYWLSVNHTRDGDIRIERWESWATAMHYCLLWAPNSAPDANWRHSESHS